MLSEELWSRNLLAVGPGPCSLTSLYLYLRFLSPKEMGCVEQRGDFNFALRSYRDSGTTPWGAMWGHAGGTEVEIWDPTPASAPAVLRAFAFCIGDAIEPSFFCFKGDALGSCPRSPSQTSSTGFPAANPRPG